MSSKFSRYPTPRLRPPICFPPPGSCWPKWSENYPHFLNGYYRWKDWHPPHPIDRQRIIRIQRLPFTTTWYGQFFHDDGFCAIHMYPLVMNVSFAIRLDCHIHPDEWLWHIWSPVYTWSAYSFDSGVLTMVNEPDIDFRKCRLLGPTTLFKPKPP